MKSCLTTLLVVAVMAFVLSTGHATATAPSFTGVAFSGDDDWGSPSDDSGTPTDETSAPEEPPPSDDENLDF